jgi:hypothetical protein
MGDNGVAVTDDEDTAGPAENRLQPARARVRWDVH